MMLWWGFTLLAVNSGYGFYKTVAGSTVTDRVAGVTACIFAALGAYGVALAIFQ